MQAGDRLGVVAVGMGEAMVTADTAAGEVCWQAGHVQAGEASRCRNKALALSNGSASGAEAGEGEGGGGDMAGASAGACVALPRLSPLAWLLPPGTKKMRDAEPTGSGAASGVATGWPGSVGHNQDSMDGVRRGDDRPRPVGEVVLSMEGSVVGLEVPRRRVVGSRVVGSRNGGSSGCR